MAGSRQAPDHDTLTQLRLVAELSELFARADIAFWLRGGWALDFNIGRVTRSHEDIDLVARSADGDKIRATLEAHGYDVARVTDDAAIHFAKEEQDIGVAFIETDARGRSVTPDREFWPWPDGAFPDAPKRLEGIQCRAMSLDALLEEKENYERHTGRPLRPKDHASVEVLRSLLAGGVSG